MNKIKNISEKMLTQENKSQYNNYNINKNESE